MQHRLSIFLLLAFPVAPTRAADDALTERRFRELHTALRPAADAPWRSIPWNTSLLAAQKQAAEQGRPIFIWAMDGHPLGCT